MDRRRQVVSTMALFAVLSLVGLRTVHTEPTVLPTAAAKATATSSTPCYLCDTPECAIIRPVAVLTPPREAEHDVLLLAQSAVTRDDHIPLYVRPPPVI